MRVSLEYRQEPLNYVAYDHILQRHIVDLDHAVLRIHSMLPASVICGVTQGHQYMKADEIRKAGYALIKRNTGGLAVLCTEEDVGHTLHLQRSCYNGNARQLYFFITEIIKDALLDLGVKIGDSAHGPSGPAVCNEQCFNAAMRAEIVNDRNEKIYGAAFRSLTDRYIFQGMVPTSDEYKRLEDFQTGSKEPIQASHVDRTWHEVAEAIVISFSRHFDVNRQDFTSIELRECDSVKYIYRIP